MFFKNIQLKINNWFEIFGFLSKTGALLIFASFILTFISYGKGIQILMFIPSFVVALFIFSFFDIYFLKKNIKVKFLNHNGKTYLQIIWKKKEKYSLFKFVFFDGKKIHFLSPKNNFIFEKKDLKGKYILIIQGKIDIFRHKIELKNPYLKENSFSKGKGFDKDLYFFSRKIEDGEGVERIDYIRTAKTDQIFLKEKNIDKSKSEENAEKKENLIYLFSKSKISLIKNVKKGEYLEWLIILVGIIVIFLEWKNILFLSISGISSIFIFILNIFYNKRINSTLLMKLSFLILFSWFFWNGYKGQDRIQAGAIFLLIGAILKHLFKKEFRDSFTYIFLILFIFVALSLLALKSWFIIFFAIFIFLTVNIFIIYSGGDLKNEFSKYFVANKKLKSKLFTTYLSIFFLTILLFFVLPHGEKEKQDLGLNNQKNSQQKTGFDDKVSLNNIRELKNDYSKIFVFENPKEEKIPKYSTTYWRGMRFSHFQNYNWEKIPQRDSRIDTISLKGKKTEKWKIKYYLDSSKNIFVPKTPIKNSDYNIVQYGFDNTIFYYKNPQQSAKKITFTFEVKNGNIIEGKSEIKFININIDKKVEKLFKKYWDSIPKKYLKNPGTISKYVREKSGFSYSIKEPAKNLDSFLYGTKKGYCEYYATVLALTLQKFGYKATLVNGFYGGEWNELAEVWVVRGADAHSRVEVLNEKGKWDIYDATPVERYQKFWFDEINITKNFIKYYDLIELKWYNYIVGFTGVEQKKIWAKIFKNYDLIISFSLFILLIILAKKIIRIDIIPHFKRNKKERFLWWLKNKTKSNVFILKNLEEKHPKLVEKTRKIIFSKKGGNLKKLKKEWKKEL